MSPAKDLSRYVGVQTSALPMTVAEAAGRLEQSVDRALAEIDLLRSVCASAAAALEAALPYVVHRGDLRGGPAARDSVIKKIGSAIALAREASRG